MDLLSLQACAHLVIALCFLPVSLFVASAIVASDIVYSYAKIISLRLLRRPKILNRQPKILITGAGSPQGLHLSRAFSRYGCQVVGADFEPLKLYCNARWSKALVKFYPLRPPNSSYGPWLFVKDTVRLVEKEKIEIWINCSDNVSLSDCEHARRSLKETECICFVPSERHVAHFQDKGSFLDFLKSLSLPIPEYHQVKSRNEIHNVLNGASGKRKYLLKPAAGGVTNVQPGAVMLPRRTISQTYQQISQIPIRTETPWVLEQHFGDSERYTTFMTAVRGQLKLFAAAKIICAGRSLQAVPTTSGVGRALLNYVRTMIDRMGEDFTMQLSFDFHVLEKATSLGYEKDVLPTDCTTLHHPASLLFSKKEDANKLVIGYLSSPGLSVNGESSLSTIVLSDVEAIATPSSDNLGVYSLEAEASDFIFRSLSQLLTLRSDVLAFVRDASHLLLHALFWKEEYLDFWDPLPALWHYELEVPLRLLIQVLTRRK